MKLRTLIALFALLAAPVLFAQDPFVEALRKYQAGELGQARVLIDQAVASEAHEADPEAWLLRGFVYKDLYKAAVGKPEGDEARDEAFTSLFNCKTLDRAGTYKDNADQAYEYIVRATYNEAAKALNDGDEARALSLFNKYKEATLRVDPKADLKSREIEFVNALGTVFTKRFNQDRTRVEWFDKAVETYLGVLIMDPDNYGSNYNLATLYYNRGVYNIRNISAADDIPSMEEIQRVSREFFQLALPYMLKAHDMNPSRRETLLGLEGIYYSLQDQSNSDKFRQLFELLPPEDGR